MARSLNVSVAASTFALVLLLVPGCKDATAPQPLQGPAPVIDSIAPSRGTVGTEVRIYGRNISGDALTARFGSLQTVRVERDGDVIYAFAPAGLIAGSRYDVRIANGDGASGVLYGAFEAVAPVLSRINGVSRPTGLVGMTVVIDGAAFGDVMGEGAVYFEGSDGVPIRASVDNPDEDWTDSFIITTVPTGTADSSRVWVETATGTSDAIGFQLISTGVFSPSNIHWTQTSPLPEPLQGLGAAFVPVEDVPLPAKYVFAVAGADEQGNPTGGVYRARVRTGGTLDPWALQTALPATRAFHTTTAATAYTAALDTTSVAAVLYAIGGKNSAGATERSVFRATVSLDGELGGWLPQAELPVALHSAGAVVFRGFLYLAGGADSTNRARDEFYRAQVFPDGTLGEWEQIGTLPQPRAHFSLVGFGPFLYAVGGETAVADPKQHNQTGTESGAVHLAQLSLRSGLLRESGWAPVAAMPKVRSKHRAVFAGGSLFLTSGVYPGQPGSTENIYAPVASDGTLSGWNGATGSQTILAALGHSLFNQAMVTFVEEDGTGRVLVLGGGIRERPGEVSSAVLYY
jgi:hypothetical protein